MPTTRRSTLVSSSSPLEASRSHRPRPPPRPCRHQNASSPSSFVVRVLSNRSTRVCFLFSVFFFVLPSKERKRVGFRVSVRTRRRCVFLREKNEAHQSRERDRFVGRLLVRDWYDDDDDDDDRCARIIIINQSINRFQEEEEEEKKNASRRRL